MKPSTLSASAIEKELRSLGTKERAAASAWYFKTGKGEYGHGDIFIGATVPEQRKVAKNYQALPLGELEKLLQSRIHECRLTALLVLVLQFEKGSEQERSRIVRFYLSHTDRINNWDLVDSSARQILGTYLLQRDRNILYKLARSKKLWERRISIIATHAFIAHHEYDDTLTLAQLLLSDSHDLMHKAVGWTLREVGKRSKPALVEFLTTHQEHMPRTALRYAIERFPEAERKAFLKPRKPGAFA